MLSTLHISLPTGLTYFYIALQYINIKAIEPPVCKIGKINIYIYIVCALYCMSIPTFTVEFPANYVIKYYRLSCVPWMFLYKFDHISLQLTWTQKLPLLENRELPYKRFILGFLLGSHKIHHFGSILSQIPNSTVLRCIRRDNDVRRDIVLSSLLQTELSLPGGGHESSNVASK